MKLKISFKSILMKGNAKWSFGLQVSLVRRASVIIGPTSQKDVFLEDHTTEKMVA